MLGCLVEEVLVFVVFGFVLLWVLGGSGNFWGFEGAWVCAWFRGFSVLGESFRYESGWCRNFEVSGLRRMQE